MSTTRKSQRFRSEFSSDEEDLVQSTKMEKAKKKSIMTTVDPGKKSHTIDVSKLSDDELRQKIIDLGYDPGPIVESTRDVYERKLKDLLTSESTGDKSPNGTSVNDSDQYSDEDEAVEITRPINPSSGVQKRIPVFENNLTRLQVSSSEKEITSSKYKPTYTSPQDDIRYPSSFSLSSDRFNFQKSNKSSDLRDSTFNRTYDKQYERSDFTQLSRGGIHRDYRASGGSHSISSNLPLKKTKTFYIICSILIFLVVAIFFVYHNLESNQPYEDSILIGKE